MDRVIPNLTSKISKNQKLLAWSIGLIVLIVVPLIMQNSMPVIVSRLCLVGIFAMVILGLDLLSGYAGQTNLGLQGFFAIGAYTTAILTTHRLAILPGWLGEPFIAMIIGIILSTIIGLALSFAIIRTAHFYQAMLTLAFGMIVYTIAMGWRDVFGGPNGIVDIPVFSIGPLELNSDLEYFYLIWAILLVAIIFCNRLVKSRWGLACQALRCDEGAASVMGVNTYRYKVQLFLITVIISSIAGSIFAHYMRVIAPEDVGVWIILTCFMGLFFGGVHTLWGALIGAALLQALPALIGAGAQVWPNISGFTDIINGLIFILIIFYMPRGVFNAILDIFRKRKQKRESLVK